MKKIVYTICALFALASCAKEEFATQEPDGEDITLSLTLEEPDYVPQTRAEVKMGRYLLEMYEAKLTAEPVKMENTDGKFSVTLKKGVDYVCLFWADGGATAYNAADQAAYCLSVSFNSKDFETNKAVTLKNATAQVNFVEAAGLTAADNTLNVTYAAGAALNVGTGKVTEVAGAVTHTFTGIAKAAKDATLATDYVLAPLTEKLLLNIAMTFNTESEKPLTNVPLQQNHRTNIKGEYSNLYNSVFTISNEVGDYEDSDEVETELPPFTVRNITKGKLKEAIAAAGLATSEKIIILGPVNDADWGTDGIGKLESSSYPIPPETITNSGRVADIAGMNAAIKTYNDTAEADKKCGFSFVDGGSASPTLQEGAPN